MTMGPWGVHYERTETWWEQSTAWHQYLARCQFLLQRGLFVADLCYLTDESAYTKAPSPDELQPRPPAGYDYDLASPEIVLQACALGSSAGASPSLWVIASISASFRPSGARQVARATRWGAACPGKAAAADRMPPAGA